MISDRPMSDTARQTPWAAHAVVMSKVLEETPGVRTYEVKFRDRRTAESFRFLPGQFNMLYVPGIGEAAISISSDAQRPDKLLHTIRTVGGVTSAIESGGVGFQLGLRGPFGSHWPAVDGHVATDAPDVVVVAGGIGLAPLRAVLYQLARRKSGRAILLMGARTPEDLLYQAEYPVWQSQGIEVHATVDRPSANWNGNIGVVTALLQRLPLPRPESTLLMTCGPEVMMRYVCRTALQRGFLPSNLWLTLERHMNCAIGYCGHCQLGPAFLCKDGPVLPYPRIAPWMDVESL